MDGNGRWATRNGLPRLAGHREGVKSAREIVRVCGELGVGVLTLYTFSTENFRRSRTEVDALMTLLVTTIGREVRNLMDNNVRLSVIGRLDQIPNRTRRALESAIERLKDNSGLHLVLAIAYGARQELIDAVNRLLESGEKQLGEEQFSDALYTKGIPDPDLIIRTSGEMRLSNFLLWQAAYSELVVKDTLWPDFRREELMQCLNEYSKRERRFGARSSQET
ncbi:MAG: di-trans,poly-cis-decaprenylcistransferase [Calditrichaeota bacterium]|nr:di-trans,poly-cis-decaprenylcistransferase [Calditrichota bacterium]MCB9366367.1 di-trans,poly-cis-decaprenylcistransferase [Calditrichota bacterium]MCB9392003.1 di-trans,poly-cis-decaprenylcistransferase [Calditrichota bacterium]